MRVGIYIYQCKLHLFLFFSNKDSSVVFNIFLFLLSDFIFCVLSIHQGVLQSLAQQVSASVNDTVVTNIIRTQHIFLSYFSAGYIIHATSFR